MKILLDHNADVSFKWIPLISRKKVHTTSWHVLLRKIEEINTHLFNFNFTHF
jgi:hypothetical protein